MTEPTPPVLSARGTAHLDEARHRRADTAGRREAERNTVAELPSAAVEVPLPPEPAEADDGEYARAGAPSSLAPMRGAKQAKEAKQEPAPVAEPVVFRGLLGEIVAAAGPHTEADPVGVLVSLLAGVGAVIGPGPHLLVGSTRHPLLVWPLLFGRTGTGRKGETGETAGLFLAAASADAPNLSVSGLSSGEGLIERIRDPGEADDEKAARGRAAPPAGTTDKRLLVIEPEFATVMARAKREGSTLAAVLRQAWDGRALSVLNRTALRASSSHVAIVGHITPREFRLRLAETELSGGTYNRFFPIYVERSKRLPMPDPIPPATVTALGAALRHAVLKARKTSRVNLDREASALWAEELYDELTAADDEDAAWTEFTRRAAPYCLRIAALFAVLGGRQLLDAGDLHAAAALVRYSIASARYVLDGQGRDPRLDRLRRALDSAPDGLTRSDVSALFSRKLSAEVLDEVLGQVLDSGDYEANEVSTGGRCATRYRRARLG